MSSICVKLYLISTRSLYQSCRPPESQPPNATALQSSEYTESNTSISGSDPVVVVKYPPYEGVSAFQRLFAVFVADLYRFVTFTNLIWISGLLPGYLHPFSMYASAEFGRSKAPNNATICTRTIKAAYTPTMENGSDVRQDASSFWLCDLYAITYAITRRWRIPRQLRPCSGQPAANCGREWPRVGQEAATRQTSEVLRCARGGSSVRLCALRLSEVRACIWRL